MPSLGTRSRYDRDGRDADPIVAAAARRCRADRMPGRTDTPLLDLVDIPILARVNPSVAITDPVAVRWPFRFSISDRACLVLTVKLAVLVAVAPGVVTETCPVVAPWGRGRDLGARVHRERTGADLVEPDGGRSGEASPGDHDGGPNRTARCG